MIRSVLFLVLVSRVVLADGPPTIEPLVYSGVLLNSVGVPVTSSNGIRLALFDSETLNLPANRRCETMTQTVTPDAQGRFRLPLEANCLAAVKGNPNLWVQLEVAGVTLPRSKLGAVPYAIEADRALSALSATNATNATNATAATGALATTVAAKAESTALAALAARVVTLEARNTVTEVVRVFAVVGDPGFNDCAFNNAAGFPQGACARMAAGKCVTTGYRGGWLEGNQAGGGPRL